jgi:hypothetical protein
MSESIYLKKLKLISFKMVEENIETAWSQALLKN